MPVNQKNEPECNCIMSGFAQTTNYCPVHKGVPIKNEPQQMYRFRKWISDEERAEVMKIIKYTKGGLIYQDSYDAHPELQTYFEPVEQNEPHKIIDNKQWANQRQLKAKIKLFLNEPQRLVNGKWIRAEQEPYYPSLLERITHFFGKHWYYECDHCLLCGKKGSHE